MSSLAYTASFVRMGRSPFGTKPKDIGVFAQHLTGGLTIFTNLREPDSVLRLRVSELASPIELMAGFAVVEPGIELTKQAALAADRVREARGPDGSEDVRMTPDEAASLARAVEHLDVSLILVDCGVSLGDVGLDLDFGDWAVAQAVARFDD
jgi:hypothetical protein